MARNLGNLITELRDEVIERLKNRPLWLSFKDIEENTGIPVSWLKALATDRIADPGVCRIQTVKAYLDSRIPK